MPEKKEFSKEEKIAKAEEEIQWLNKQKKDLTDVIEKRVITQKTSSQESNMRIVRMAIIGIICFVVFGGIALITGFLNQNPILRLILIVVLTTFVFTEIYYKIRGKQIGIEVTRIIKEASKNPEVIKKFTEKEETQRLNIIEQKIIERKDDIYELKEIKKHSQETKEERNLDLPDVSLNLKI